jgi:hypothetical protein
MISNSARHTFIVSAVAFFLSGCGGSQSPIGAPGAVPQASTVSAHAARGKSWMLPGAKSGDLIYVVDGCGGTCVLSYPGGRVVGALSAGGSDVCSDEQGNVFIPAGYTISEYAHGGTSPIAILSLPGEIDGGCAVDPATNNLAVVSEDSSTKTDIAIFAQEGGTPNLYTSHIEALFCGYDNKSDLFVDGYSGQQPGFAELPLGGTDFTALSLPYTVGQPGEVQWDGKYITYESRTPLKVSRLAISGSTATIVSATLFSGLIHYAVSSWIFGSKILVPYNTHGVPAYIVGIWKYPRGGNAIRTIHRFGNYRRRQQNFQGVTLSVAPPRPRGHIALGP